MTRAASPAPASLRTLRADDLDLELERPETAPRGVVIFVPGLFATSQFFRVDAEAGKSVTRVLREDLAFVVVHYDPRGLGRNQGRRRALIDFAARVADLRAVVDAVHRTFPDLPLFLVGHSFGGTAIYALLASGAPSVRGAVTIGSPARLVPRQKPWEKLFTAGTAKLVEQLAAEDWLDAVAFAFVQNRIYSGRDNLRWLPLWAIRCGLAATKRSRVLAYLNVRAPKAASIAYTAGNRAARDYAPRELQAVLRAGTLHRESATLLVQLLAWGQSGGAIALPDGPSLAAVGARVSTPTLVAFSPQDAMVRPEEACAWDGPATVSIDVGACGHGGFFYKAGPRAVLFANLVSFLRDRV